MSENYRTDGGWQEVVIMDVKVDSSHGFAERAKIKSTTPKSRPSTARTRRLKQVFMDEKPKICAERSVLVTETYKETEALPPVSRQAMAFAKVLDEMPLWIRDDELIVSNLASAPGGSFLFPEYDETWVLPELDTIATRRVDPWQIEEDDKALLRETNEYWSGRNMTALADARAADEVLQAVESHSLFNSLMGKMCGVGHIAPDIEGVIKRGLNANIAEAEAHIARLDITNPEDFAKLPFLKAVILADKAAVRWAGRFAALAREQAATAQDEARKRELEEIAAVCDWVPANPARNFREAVQAAAFIMATVQIEQPGVSISTGRLDQYFYPYYRQDVDAGMITEAQALEMLECLWIKLAESRRVSPELGTFALNGYPIWMALTVGGQTGDGYDATNDISYMFLDVSSNLQIHEPMLTARIHKRSPHRFLMACCEANKAHGGGLPALFNDEPIIESQLFHVPGITKEDACDYSIVGCSDVVCAGKGTEGLPYQAISLARVMEHMLEARDPVSGNQLASGVGDMFKWNGFDDLMEAFREQARIWARITFLQLLPLVELHGKQLPCPYMSSLMRDSIGRARPFYDGGAVYGSHATLCCLIGIGTLANSMAAVRKLVFDDKILTMSQLKHALETDFGDESTTPSGPAIRAMCLNAPKYGNDDPYVDNIAKDCLTILTKEMWQYETKPRVGYGAVVSPVTAHIAMGFLSGATPDGRKAMTPLSDACSPSQGTETKGPTAAIKSVSNLEHVNLSQGSVFNMRVHPASVQSAEGMASWANLIRTYFDLGGWELQFNVVDAEVLKAAQQHPEDYKDLVVRVVGYSAFFVELDKMVQDDIISRTEFAI
jgi:pyruvate formate-lyase/glycerol dehydratase family glycyl radical enzyme